MLMGLLVHKAAIKSSELVIITIHIGYSRYEKLNFEAYVGGPIKKLSLRIYLIILLSICTQI